MNGQGKRILCSLAVAIVLAGSGTAADKDGAAPPAPTDGTLAYVLTDLSWAVYTTPDGKAECPAGFNDGNREQFVKLFPNDGAKRTLLDTELRREIDGWYPTTAPEPFTFREAQGPVSYGLNLDGKVGANDFISPEGEKGVDNQLYRVLGCIRGYRPPDGYTVASDIRYVRYGLDNRIIVRLTNVHSVVNDNDVNVTIYRGRDPLPLDVTGKKALPGGVQRIDTRWGSKYILHLHGKITDGVLTTEAADWLYPWSGLVVADQYMYGARFKLKLTATGAEGIIGGYSDIETWYLWLMRTYGTLYQQLGWFSAPSIYKALARLADGHPDPRTGVNMAISSALQAKFVSVTIAPSSLPQVSAAESPHPMVPFAGLPFRRPAAEEIYPGIQGTSPP